MDEFATEIRDQATQLIRRVQRQAAQPGVDPMLELVALLLSDETGALRPEAANSLSKLEWEVWNLIALDRPRDLTSAITTCLETERVPLPAEVSQQRQWAIALMLEVLDSMEIK